MADDSMFGDVCQGTKPVLMTDKNQEHKEAEEATSLIKKLLIGDRGKRGGSMNAVDPEEAKANYGGVDWVDRLHPVEVGGEAGEDMKGASCSGVEFLGEGSQTVSLAKLFCYATPLDMVIMLFGSLAALVHGAGWPALNLLFGDLFDEFINFENLTIPAFPSPTNLPQNSTYPPMPFDPYKVFDKEIEKYALRFVYVGIAVMFTAYIQVACWSLTGERQTQRLRKEYFNAILHQEVAWYDKHQSGEITSRLADDMERVREGVGDKVGVCLQFTSQFLSGFAIGFWKSWELALVIMSLTPLLVMAGSIMAYLVTSFSSAEQAAYAQAGSVAEEVFSCIRTVIAFGGEKKEVNRYEKELQCAKDLGIKKGIISGLGLGLTFLIVYSTYALAFWYGPKMVSEGRITGGEVMTVFFCVMIGSFSIGNVIPALTSVLTAKGAAGTIHDIIDRKPAIDTRLPHGIKPKEMTGNIRFENVHFTYPTRPDVPVLRGLSLDVGAGQTVALVGGSGCGKSTTVNLLMRFYDVLGGQIFIDGNEIRDLNLSWLRNNIGVVCQEPVLFNCSIQQNILYGREGVTKAEIIQAAKMANAHDFITKLPEGYDTLVGERGAQLSGGQKQRIAIARALVRNPPILLLDEATSALDRESEKLVQQALDKASEGRTTFAIAHRLSTIQNADLIYAMSDGRVAEYGTHAELMKMGGVYKQLVTLQMINNEEDEQEDNDDDNMEDEEMKESGRSGSYKKVGPQSSFRQSHHSSKRMDQEIEKEDEDVPNVSYWEILKLNAPEWHYIMIGCFFSGLMGVTMPTIGILFSEIFTVFTYPPDQIQAEAVFWSLMFFVLGCAMFLGYFISTSCLAVSGERLTLRLRKIAFWSLLRQDVAYFDQPHHSTGALSSRLSADASNVKGATGLRISTAIQSLTTVVAAIVVGFIFGWKLALLIFALLPLLVIAGSLQVKLLQGTQKKDSQLLEEAGKVAAESISNIRTVASLMLEESMYQSYADMLLQPFVTSQRNAQVYGSVFAVSQAVIFFMYAAAFRFGGYLVSTREMQPDEVFTVVIGIGFAGISLGQSSAFLPEYAKARQSANTILHLFTTQPQIDNYSKAGLKPAELEGEIQYSDLRFRYPARPDIQILKGLNLTIKPGQTVAIVGESGCGKSTLVSLLERFYDPSEGSVSVDGHCIKDLNIQWLRANMAVVSQEPILFACSIKDNIQYSVDGELDMLTLDKVTKMANIHDFIASLPMGYDTLVGEKGTQLSGGQKQRVAIARALARNPRILLLDEATSALDTESEKVVQEALVNAMQGRTSIVIAHRLSTVQNADVIAVVRDGVVVECGSHQELLNSKGHYYTLTEGQMNKE